MMNTDLTCLIVMGVGLVVLIVMDFKKGKR
jgi:hypothetical protein